MTLRKMSVAMKSEQRGSAINQPNWRMRMVEMITPTLPNVSARTWRKTPGGRRTGGHFIWPQHTFHTKFFLSRQHTSHVCVHASAPGAMGVPVSAVPVPVPVPAVRVPVAPVAVFAVGVAVVRVTVVV